MVRRIIMTSALVLLYPVQHLRHTMPNADVVRGGVGAHGMTWDGASMMFRTAAWQERKQLASVALAVGEAFFVYNLIKRPYENPLHQAVSIQAQLTELVLLFTVVNYQVGSSICPTPAVSCPQSTCGIYLTSCPSGVDSSLRGPGLPERRPRRRQYPHPSLRPQHLDRRDDGHDGAATLLLHCAPLIAQSPHRAGNCGGQAGPERARASARSAARQLREQEEGRQSRVQTRVFLSVDNVAEQPKGPQPPVHITDKAGANMVACMHCEPEQGGPGRCWMLIMQRILYDLCSTKPQIVVPPGSAVAVNRTLLTLYPVLSAASANHKGVSSLYTRQSP
eukprot:3385041-Rhodomonas_salina.3